MICHQSATSHKVRIDVYQEEEEEQEEDDEAQQGHHTWLSLVARGFRAGAGAVALEALAGMPCPAAALCTGTAAAPEIDDNEEEEAPEPVAEEEAEDDEDASDLASDPGLICRPCCAGRTLLLARVCCFPVAVALDAACEGIRLGAVKSS